MRCLIDHFGILNFPVLLTFCYRIVHSIILLLSCDFSHSFFFTQYLRLSAKVPGDVLKDHFMTLWDKEDKDKIPELAITFLGGCDEDLLSESVKDCLMKCMSNVC